MSEALRVDKDYHPIIPQELALESMRDNGYKNAAYAIAELIDNAIQAGATKVNLLCSEEDVAVQLRRRRRVRQIAVLDNGSGMNADVLRMALQVGNGMHLHDRTGIGRFGMGLPSASISQCRRLDVWSWQGGRQNAVHSYLDVGQITSGKMREVPKPETKAIPPMWFQTGKGWGDSGTLVVWSEFDRLMWRSARAIIDNSEFLIGRMYRRFLSAGNVVIRMAAFLEDEPGVMVIDKQAVANDPLYLLVPSSTPKPYDKTPMFEKWGDQWEVPFKIEGTDNQQHTVIVRMTTAKKEARQPSATGQNAGDLPHGHHAGRNVGVSMMRAGRELELLTSGFVIIDPRERWWGVEVEFPPALDEIFGVTNNKQAARNFSEAAMVEWESMLEEGETVTQLKERLQLDNDPRGPLLEIADYIKRNLRTIRRGIADQQRTSNRRYTELDPNSPERQGTTRTDIRKKEGYRGESDVDEETLPADKRADALAKALIDRGVPEERAKELAGKVVATGIKYVFAEAAIDTPAFFSVESKGGVLTITLNTQHPAYESLLEVLQPDADPKEDTPEELHARLTAANKGLKLLLEAWARYEDEESGQMRERLQEARTDWGKVARMFLSTDGGG